MCVCGGVMFLSSVYYYCMLARCVREGLIYNIIDDGRAPAAVLRRSQWMLLEKLRRTQKQQQRIIIES